MHGRLALHRRQKEPTPTGTAGKNAQAVASTWYSSTRVPSGSVT